MNLMSNITEYGLGTFCYSIVEYSLRTSQALPLGEAGYFIIQGAAIEYHCIKDLCNGNIKKGLLKGVLGTLSIARGVLKLAEVINRANEWQCAIWPQSRDGFSQSIAVQHCNAFECKYPPVKLILECSSENQCCTFPPSLSSITLLGSRCTRIRTDWPNGFSHLYEMREAISSDSIQALNS